MILNHLAERLSSQIKHPNCRAKTGSKYLPGLAVRDAEGKKTQTKT